MKTAVLFDLDGTLLDTAPDMAGALNRLRTEIELEPLPVDALREAVNGGAVALIRAGMPAADAEQLEVWRLQFLQVYGESPAENTRLFRGFDKVLDELDARGHPWGVVTNKLHRFTIPVLERTGLAARCATICSGDTTSRPKPDPGSILHACKEVGVEPAHAIMVGDAERDIAAGRAAGTRTIAVRWGYIESGDDPADWGADFVHEQPEQLLDVFDG